MVLRQSVKTILAVYVLCGILEIAIAIFWFTSADKIPVLARDGNTIPVWVPLLVPLAIQIYAAIRHVGRLTSSLTIAGERIRYEAGLLSKSTRVMELSKVQDVRVDQSIGQRLLNTGDLSVETAGETSRITLENVDGPHRAAEHILALSRAERQKGKI